MTATVREMRPGTEHVRDQFTQWLRRFEFFRKERIAHDDRDHRAAQSK
ncbi:hypothetical protein ACETU7_14690 [Rhodococcus sp. 3Y1]